MHFCDECDNSSVKYESTGPSTSDYELATQRWHQISDALMEKLGTDYQLTPRKLQDQIFQASGSTGTVQYLGNYQLILNSTEEKSFITDGFRSGSADLFQSIHMTREQVVTPFEDCANDEHVAATFLRQNIVSFSKA